MEHKAVTIRYPATANLMIDSFDRNFDISGSSEWNFQISKGNSIMNGFFSRIATTEVVLEWNENNIDVSNNFIKFDLSGVAANTYAGIQNIQLMNGCWNASQVLDYIVQKLNDASGTTNMGFTFNPPPINGLGTISATGGKFFISDVGYNPILARQLGFDTEDFTYTTYKAILETPDLRPFRYLDFVSAQLTYTQSVKDNSTNLKPRDVLCRWYFSFDNPPTLDKYGYPILMGYSAFCLRRIFNPPKQIKWDYNLPVGNLRFEVLDEEGNVIPPDPYFDKSNWLMTLQVSEN